VLKDADTPDGATEGAHIRGVGGLTMKRINLLTLYFVALSLLGSLSAAQELSAPTTALYVINNIHGVALQYSMQQGATTAFYATKQRTSYSFSNTANVLEIQTVGGVTELNALNSNNGACHSGNCSYSGTFSELRMETVALSDGSSRIRMSGDLLGTFTDPGGNVYTNIVAHYYTETYPATDGVTVGAVGGLTIVLTYN
jgi:hypothetical protein